MTTTPQPTWQPSPLPPRWGAGRIVALVLGLLLLVPATGLLLGGAVLLWADRAERTDDGYLVSSEDTLAGPGYALVSERIDLETGADWVPLSSAFGTARIEATGTAAGSETFIGIAPVSEATAYLDGVQRTVIEDLGIDSPARHELPGTAPSGPPTEQDFWTAQVVGPATQQLSWVPEEGDWMLVVMNADGSAGVSVTARLGATVPALDGIAVGLLVAGLVFLVVAALLLVLAVRRRYDRRTPAQPVAWPGPAGPHQPAGPQHPVGPSSAGSQPAPSTAWPQTAAPPSAGQPAAPPNAGQLPPWVPPAQADRTTAPDGQPSAERTPNQP